MARTVPVSSTQAPGNFITGALWNAGPAASNTFLTAVPVAAVYQSSAQSIANGATAALAFDATLSDSDLMHSNVTNNTRLTCQVAGLYFIAAAAVFLVNATGNRTMQLYKNGTAYNYAWNGETALGGSNASGVFTVGLVQMAVGDYVEAFAFQSSGGSLNTFTSGPTSSMQAFWVRT